MTEAGGAVGAATAAEVATFEVDGLRFRDLDHDGVLAPYEDWRLPADDRAADLLGRMTLPEITGLLVHASAPAIGGQLSVIGVGDGYDLDTIATMIGDWGVHLMISRLSLAPDELAEQNNELQRLAARGRLGIPVLLSSDPRHHFGGTIGISHTAETFSQWPEPLGLGAIGEPDVVRRFGDVVRRDYRAIGFHMALSPQADLATSPRWPRIEGTFGEHPDLVRRLVGAYVEGVQGGTAGVTTGSVAAIVKHWVGYGATTSGFDGHNWYGRFSSFPSGAFDDHVHAFRDALAAGVAGVMPTYSILDGLVLDGEPVEAVAAGFNRQLVDGLLRTTHGYRGFVLSDWSITRDMTESCRTGVPPQTPAQIATPWGVEHLDRPGKIAAAINAGVDQIGGENDPRPVLEAVERGLLTETRVREAAGRILGLMFRLGIFDDPFVDAAVAPTAVRDASSVADAAVAQRRSLTVVTRGRVPAVRADDIVFVDGLAAAPFESAGLRTTTSLADATVAVVRVAAPYELLHPGHFFGARQHEGALDYPDDHPDLVRVRAAADAVPTIVIAHLDRPAVLGPIVERADSVIAEFGASPAAIVDVLTGAVTADGRLPFRLPADMDQVMAQPCDRPDDSLVPLFPFGHRAP